MTQSLLNRLSDIETLLNAAKAELQQKPKPPLTSPPFIWVDGGNSVSVLRTDVGAYCHALLKDGLNQMIKP